MSRLSTKRERGFEVAMGSLDQALGLGVARFAQHDLDPERPAEGLRRGRGLLASSPPAADGTLSVPHERLRHRTKPPDQLPLAGEQILGAPGRDQQAAQHAGVT